MVKESRNLGDIIHEAEKPDMEDLLKKVTNYQLFNFLLTGVVLVVLLNETTGISLIYDNVIVQFFAFYFIGSVLSRIGSIIVEPSLNKLGVIKYEPYQDYIAAAKKDEKLDTLSQENNTYRTLVATFIAFVALYTTDTYATTFIETHTALVTYIFAAMMFVLFVLAYRKQTKYITNRIKASKR